MNYLQISDYLWYAGHVLSGLAILINPYNYYIAATLVLTGQCITIISRPIGRIKDEIPINPINLI